MSLGKALKGGLWYSIFNYSSSAVNIAGNLILVRLIAPEDFGFYAFLVAATEAVFIFSKLNFSIAAVSLQNESEVFGTAYRMACRVGFVSLVLSLVLSYFVQGYFDSQALHFFWALSAINFLRFPSSVLQAFLEKDYLFKLLGKLKLITMVTSTLACLLAAWSGAGVWSLYIKDAVIELMLLLLLLSVAGGRLQKAYNKCTAEKLMTYSKKVFLLSSFEFIYNRSPRLFLGAFAGNRVLGFFERSHYLSLLPNSVVLPFTEKVAFTYFAKNKNLADDKRSEGLQLGLYILTVLLLPFSMLVLYYPRPFIYLLLGEQWVEADKVLQGACLLFYLIPVYGLLKHALIAQGIINRVTFSRLLSCFALVIGSFLSYRYSRWELFTWFMSLGGLAAILSLVYFLRKDNIKVLTLGLMSKILIIVCLSIITYFIVGLGSIGHMLTFFTVIYALVLLLEYSQLIKIYRRIR